ncbi:MAG: hypothetical protein WEH44_06270 [Pirellulaceae bacterium]
MAEKLAKLCRRVVRDRGFGRRWLRRSGAVAGKPRLRFENPQRHCMHPRLEDRLGGNWMKAGMRRNERGAAKAGITLGKVRGVMAQK